MVTSNQCLKKWGFILLVVLLIGCGTRKRAVEKSTFKKDVIFSDNFDASRFLENSTILSEDKYNITLEPIDLTRPIIYRTDTIYNSKVIYQRVFRDSIVLIKDTVFLKYKSDYVDNSVKKEKKVDVETKKPNPYLWAGLTLLFLLLAYLGYRYLKR